MKTIEEIRAIKNKAEPEILEQSGVNGVDIGHLTIEGEKSEELGILIYVKNKRNISTVRKKVPEEIEEVKTEIIERDLQLHQRFVKIDTLEVKPDTKAYDTLKGGISVGPCRSVFLKEDDAASHGAESAGWYAFVGTLGAVVQDNNSGAKMLLGSYHSLCVNDDWSVGAGIVQPSRADRGNCSMGVVGQLQRASIGGQVDGAVASLSARNIESSIVDIGPVTGTSPAATGMAVRKRGRTTGLTHGTVSSVDLTIKLDFLNGQGPIILTNQIGIAVNPSENVKFGDLGDSGSVIVNGNRQVVGLYCGGTADGSFVFANPIDAVLSALNVSMSIDFKKFEPEPPFKKFEPEPPFDIKKLEPEPPFKKFEPEPPLDIKKFEPEPPFKKFEPEPPLDIKKFEPEPPFKKFEPEPPLDIKKFEPEPPFKKFEPEPPLDIKKFEPEPPFKKFEPEPPLDIKKFEPEPPIKKFEPEPPLDIKKFEPEPPIKKREPEPPLDIKKFEPEPPIKKFEPEPPLDIKKFEPEPPIKKREPEPPIKKFEPEPPLDIKKFEPEPPIKKFEPEPPINIKKNEPEPPFNIKKFEPEPPINIKKNEPEPPFNIKKFEPEPPINIKKNEPEPPIKKLEPEPPFNIKKFEPEPPINIKKNEPEPPIKKLEPEPPFNIKKFEPEPPINIKKNEPEPPFNIKKFEPEPPINVKKIEPEPPIKKFEPEPPINIKKFEPEGPILQDPGTRQAAGSGFESRLARIEAALAQLTHFIGPALRPDAQKGSLTNEPEQDEGKKE